MDIIFESAICFQTLICTAHSGSSIHCAFKCAFMQSIKFVISNYNFIKMPKCQKVTENAPWGQWYMYLCKSI